MRDTCRVTCLLECEQRQHEVDTRDAGCDKGRGCEAVLGKHTSEHRTKYQAQTLHGERYADTKAELSREVMSAIARELWLYCPPMCLIDHTGKEHERQRLGDLAMRSPISRRWPPSEPRRTARWRDDA
jgi:hypothetical protein